MPTFGLGPPARPHSSSAPGGALTLQAAPPRVPENTGMGSAPSPGKAALGVPDEAAEK